MSGQVTGEISTFAAAQSAAGGLVDCARGLSRPARGWPPAKQGACPSGKRHVTIVDPTVHQYLQGLFRVFPTYNIWIIHRQMYIYIYVYIDVDSVCVLYYIYIVNIYIYI